MNLPEIEQMQEERARALQRKRATLNETNTNRQTVGGIALIAGAAAFLITTALLTTARRMRQHREMQRYLSGETTDGLASAADAIVGLIESGSADASEESYPASFPLELEREQHRMAEAYGRLYRLLGDAERAELAEPESLLIFGGIAAYASLPDGAAVSVASAESRARAVRAGAAGDAEESGARFAPDASQLRELNKLYMLCLDIRSLVNEDNRAAYGAERSERSVARLLTAIGQRRGGY